MTNKEFMLKIANNFRLFVEVSMTYMGFTPGQIQLEMAEFMGSGEKRLAIFAARGFSKTYIVCLHICWSWLRNKHLKFVVLSNDIVKAKKIAYQCLQFLKVLPWLRHLSPKNKNVSKESFRLPGSLLEKEASLQVISVGSNATGLRCDRVYVEDAESENIDSHDKRQNVLESLQQMTALIHEPLKRPFYKRFNGEVPLPERTELICTGTFASTESIHIVPNNDSKHFLRGAKTKTFPALNEQGESAFPERISTSFLLDQRDNYLTYTYWCLQYLLDPSKVIGTECPFKMDKIKKHAVPEKKINNMSAFIDTASGGDFSVLVVGGLFERKLYIHDILYYNNETSEESLIKFVDYINRNSIREVCVEGNLATPVQIFKRLCREKKSNVRIEELHVIGNKHNRVLNMLEPSLHSGDVILNEKLLDQKHQLVKEMNAWTYNSEPPSNVHDDCCDALASFVKLHIEKISKQTLRYGGSIL